MKRFLGIAGILGAILLLLSFPLTAYSQSTLSVESDPEALANIYL